MFVDPYAFKKMICAISPRTYLMKAAQRKNRRSVRKDL